MSITKEHALIEQIVHVLSRILEASSKSTLHSRLTGLRAAMARAAQKVYDDWEQNDDGDDEVYGAGGICTDISSAIADVIADRIRDVDFHEGGQDGDDHAWIIVTDGKEAYGVDIPPGVYESGMGYKWTKRKNVRFAANDVDIFPIDINDLEEELTEEFDAALTAAAVEHFGTTRNPEEAGYILPDGRMLDLSGRHQIPSDYKRRGTEWVLKKPGRDYQSRSRNVDHREVWEIVGKSGTDGMLKFMDLTGAIRLMPSVGVSILHSPTDNQIRILSLTWNKMWSDEPLFIEVMNKSGDTIHSVELDQPITRQKILSALEK